MDYSAYQLTQNIATYACNNPFTVTMSKLAYKLGNTITPFCIYADKFNKQYGTFELSSRMTGLVNTNIRLDDDICNFWANELIKTGIKIDYSNASIKRWLLIDYLLSVSACYVELPKLQKKQGVGAYHTYDKFLATRNPYIISAWEGVLSPTDALNKYVNKIATKQNDLDNAEIRLIKLTDKSDGSHGVSVPRSAFDIQKMRIYPVFMLYAFVQGIKPILNQSIVKFSFTKDNDTVRDMCVTISEPIIRQYYTDENYIYAMMNGIDLDKNQIGTLHLPSKISRGYVRVPELGSSIYDSACGLRSLNLARVLKAEIVQSVDTTFLKVDLDSVQQHFVNHIDDFAKNNPALLPAIYQDIIQQPTQETNPILIADAIKKKVSFNISLFSTQYLRELHLYMVKHPERFTNYTGTPVAKVTNTSDYGLDTMIW